MFRVASQKARDVHAEPLTARQSPGGGGQRSEESLKMASSLVPPSAEESSALGRSLASLALTIHLFCVGVVLAASCPNFRRSALQNRLVALFAPYTQLLYFDPDFTPYYYTLGRPVDDDTWLVIDLYPSADKPVDQQSPIKTLRLPDGEGRLSLRRRQAMHLARLLALHADPEVENEDLTSEIARAAGSFGMRQANAARAVVRCMRRLSQPFDLAALNPGFPPDRPTDPAYDVTVYEADVWRDEDGEIQVLRRASRAEVAPRQLSNPQP